MLAMALQEFHHPLLVLFFVHAGFSSLDLKGRTDSTFSMSNSPDLGRNELLLLLSQVGAVKRQPSGNTGWDLDLKLIVMSCLTSCRAGRRTSPTLWAFQNCSHAQKRGV